MRRRKKRKLRPRHVIAAAAALLACACAWTLYWVARAVSPQDERASPKRERLAFLFLCRREIPTQFIWREFFDDARRNNASDDDFGIYSHPRPGYAFPATSLFAGTEVRNRTKSRWGSIHVALAEALLMRAALSDQRNARFLLLSEACVPLHPFWCLHSFLTSTEVSFVKTWATQDRAENFDFAEEEIRVKAKWRKSFQWVALTRRHATLASSDAAYHAFRVAHARSAAAAAFRAEVRHTKEFQKGRRIRVATDAQLDINHHAFADEHFVPTILALEGEERAVVPAAPTFVNFGGAKDEGGADGVARRRLLALEWHPDEARRKTWSAAAFRPEDVGPALVARFRTYCAYAKTPAPLTGPEAEVRRPLGRLVTWAAARTAAAAACRFSFDAPAPCYLALRKVPQESVAAYLATMGRWNRSRDAILYQNF